MLVGSQRRDRLCIAAYEQVIALGDRRGPQRRPRFPRLYGHEVKPPGRPDIDLIGWDADISGGRPHAQPEDAVAQPVMLDEGLGVPAEIGRQPRAALLRQQALAQQQDDRDGPDQKRQPDQRELREGEAGEPRILQRLRHQDVLRRPGQQQIRAGVGGEGERHQELRRRLAQADRRHDRDRHQRRDRAAAADEGTQTTGRDHDDDQQPCQPFGSRLRDEVLSGPGGDARSFERRADNEETGDEKRGAIAETGEGLVERDHARRPQRQRRADRDHDDRQPVPGEQHDRGHGDEGGALDRCHVEASCRPFRPATSKRRPAGWQERSGRTRQRASGENGRRYPRSDPKSGGQPVVRLVRGR